VWENSERFGSVLRVLHGLDQMDALGLEGFEEEFMDMEESGEHILTAIAFH
jgi:hypothetical protein